MREISVSRRHKKNKIINRDVNALPAKMRKSAGYMKSSRDKRRQNKELKEMRENIEE